MASSKCRSEGEIVPVLEFWKLDGASMSYMSYGEASKPLPGRYMESKVLDMVPREVSGGRGIW